MMKTGITLLGILCTTLSVAQRTPADTQEAFEKDPLIIRDTRESSTVSEAAAIITTVRTGLNTRTTGTDGSTPAFTEADYKTLTVNADNFMLQRKYGDAILLYDEILTHKSDQYAKDRIQEARALQAKQQKEEEQQKKDAILRAKAEFASSNNYEKHIVHFTGALMADEFSPLGITKVYDKNDECSNFLRPGKYDIIANHLQKANYQTLDGIAIPANTRLIVYKDINCKGEILLDITGPAIVNNVLWSDAYFYKEVNTKEFKAEIQPYFPQAVRHWSATNMHQWTKGSMEIRVEAGQ